MYIIAWRCDYLICTQMWEKPGFVGRMPLLIVLARVMRWRIVEQFISGEKVMRAEEYEELTEDQIEIVHLQGDVPQPVAGERRAFLELLLSPQSLQWMMACGSGLLVLGLAIWLWSVGVFENSLVVAAIAGGSTMGLIGFGMAMVRKTRHQLAGRWLTLLGALALPLNLWLYDAQGIVTLAHGGHLWIPAAICCLIYAGIARILRDSTFVYTLVGGTVLTGMLFLADESIGRFWQWLPPAKFLLFVGWASVFSQRLFNDDESDFSRSKFGAAFFRSGMITVASGLLLLMGGFVSNFLAPMAAELFGYFQWQHLLLTSISTPEKIWALGMIAASSIGLVVQGRLQRSAWCFRMAGVLAVWAFLLAKNILGFATTINSVAIFVALITVAWNVAAVFARSRNAKWEVDSLRDSGGIAGAMLAVAATTAVGGLQVFLHVTGETAAFVPELSWATAVQLLTACFAGIITAWHAWLVARQNESSEAMMRPLLGLVGISAMLCVWVVLLIQGSVAIHVASLVGALIPLGVVLFGRDEIVSVKLSRIASIMTTTHLVTLGGCAICGLFSVTETRLVVAAILAVASVTYFVASRKAAGGFSGILGTAAMVLAIAAGGSHYGLDFGYCLILGPAIVGAAMKVFCFLSTDSRSTEAPTIELAANGLVFSSGVSVVMLGLSRWLDGGTSVGLLVVMVASLVCTALASSLTRDRSWRTGYRALIVAMIGCSVCVLDACLDFSFWHRIEICCLVGGAVLLALGHLAWLREAEGDSDAIASLCLFLASGLVVIPLSVGLVYYRLGGPGQETWRMFHEIAVIGGSLGLLGAGLLCRIRWTTVGGASLMFAFVASLVTLVRLPDQLQSASVVMMVGGALFLGTAILMSIYRDRLVALPKKISDGEGVFQVLRWR